ncbi:MAG: LacI family DNA-binding transcriptional regulator [Aristaeellaceae bacterium]
MKQRVTLKEVAYETGLSMMTVSNYINGVHIREENARLIEAALKKLKYEPNATARNLRTNRSMTIGALISSLSDTFQTKIIKGAERVLVEKGFGLIVCDYDEDAQLFEDRLRFLRSKQIDGLITMASDDGGKLLSEIQKEIPVIQVDYPLDDFEGDLVTSDNRESSRRIVLHALEKGYRRIALIAGKSYSNTSQECVRGYKEALRRHGIEIRPEYITYGNYTAEGGRACAKQLLALEDKPEVIFVINGSMAQGMLPLFQSSSMVVGRDIAVIGRDLMTVGEVYYPRITSVEQQFERLGDETAKLLLRRIAGDRESFPSHVMLRSVLVEGESL